MPTRVNDTTRDYLRKSLDVVERMLASVDLIEKIDEAANMVAGAVSNGGKILFAGNGGSAADAQHFAGEMVSRFYYDRPPIAGIALTTDSSVLTAIGNDYGYHQTFSRQVEALGRPGDVFFAISTSGMSRNIIDALKSARSLSVGTIGLTGRNGGEVGPLCDVEIRIPSDSTPLIQQGHLIVGHLVCKMVEERIHPRKS